MPEKKLKATTVGYYCPKGDFLKNQEGKLEYYMKLPYSVLTTQEEDGSFFVKIKELSGCMTVGDSIEEALGMIEDAKREWLKVLIEEGAEILLPEIVE